MMRSAITRRHRGYTLVEVVISVVIISIMVGMVLGTYRIDRGAEGLTSEAARFSSALRNARNRAFNRIAFSFATPHCSLDATVLCDANDDCQPPSTGAPKGHCTSAEYPAGGYGVHVSDSGGAVVYTIFADYVNADGVAPNYDDPSEKLTEVSVTASLALMAGISSVGDFEVVFNDGGVSLYEDNGGWSEITPLPDSYRMRFQHAEGCGEIGKRGDVTLETAQHQVTETVDLCGA